MLPASGRELLVSHLKEMEETTKTGMAFSRRG